MTARARSPLPARAAQRLAAAVLQAEGAGGAQVSIAFVGERRIRAINRQYLGKDRTTDVIAFALPLPDARDPVPVGDIYICPAVAVCNARAAGVTSVNEMKRLVVHGTLHVLGYDHPAGAQRCSSSMWRRQERYLKRFG